MMDFHVFPSRPSAPVTKLVPIQRSTQPSKKPSFQVRADDIRAGDVVQQIFSDLGRAAGDSWREIFLLISIDFVRVQPAVRLARKLELAAEE